MPMSRKQVNADLYKNEEDFLDRAEKLKKQTSVVSKEDALKILGVPKNRLQQELPAATIALKNPGASFQPYQWSEMDRFGVEMKRYSTYSTAFRDLPKTFKLALHKLHVQVDVNGFDHKLFLVFDDSCGVDGCLDGVYLAAVPVHERDKIYIWDLFSNFAQNAASQGGKEAVSALGF